MERKLYEEKTKAEHQRKMDELKKRAEEKKVLSFFTDCQTFDRQREFVTRKEKAVEHEALGEAYASSLHSRSLVSPSLFHPCPHFFLSHLSSLSWRDALISRVD